MVDDNAARVGKEQPRRYKPYYLNSFNALADDEIVDRFVEIGVKIDV